MTPTPSSAERRRVRVAMLAHNFPRHDDDPVGSFVLRLALAVRDEGVDVTVLAPSAPGLSLRAAIAGIPVRRFRYAPASRETLAYAGTMAAQVAAGWGARAAMLALVGAEALAARGARRGADVVHAHWWFPSGLAATLAGPGGPPLVTTLHGSDVRLATGSPLAARVFRRVADRSAAVTTVSSWLARSAVTMGAATPPSVLPMPVAADLFRPGELRREPRLLFIGKLTPQKGAEEMLRALAAMRVVAALDIVGAGRVDDERVRSLASELGVADRIVWHPLLSQRELAELYRRAAIHVVPARDEGLGLTAVEALLSATPVVAFDSGGLPDVVTDHVSGRLVPAGDVPALATALDDVLSRDDGGAALGAAGRREALARFSPKAVGERYAAVYRSVSSARAQRPS